VGKSTACAAAAESFSSGVFGYVDGDGGEFGGGESDGWEGGDGGCEWGCVAGVWVVC